VNSCDQNAFRFGHYQLNQTTIEVDQLSSVSEIVVWLRETILQSGPEKRMLSASDQGRNLDMTYDDVTTTTITFKHPLSMTNIGTTYVAVHGGAGVHSHSSDRQVKHALRR